MDDKKGQRLMLKRFLEIMLKSYEGPALEEAVNTYIENDQYVELRASSLEKILNILVSEEVEKQKGQ